MVFSSSRTCHNQRLLTALHKMWQVLLSAAWLVVLLPEVHYCTCQADHKTVLSCNHTGHNHLFQAWALPLDTSTVLSLVTTVCSTV
jgi:hypothetical protein